MSGQSPVNMAKRTIASRSSQTETSSNEDGSAGARSAASVEEEVECLRRVRLLHTGTPQQIGIGEVELQSKLRWTGRWASWWW